MSAKGKAYRCMVPMTDKVCASLDRMAEVVGSSRGAVAGKFLDDMAEQIDQLAAIVEQAKLNPSAAMARLDSFADGAVAHLAETRSELAETRKAERERSAGNACSAADRVYQIQDPATGDQWCLGLTWVGEDAERALAQARSSAPDREWVLREVPDSPS